MIHRVYQYIAPLTGWRRNSCAFLLGVLATLTLPPVFALPLLIPAFTGLFWLVASAPSRQRAFLDGWWWGWGYHISGLYWFSVALLTDAEKFAWMIPFAVFGVTAVLAIYSGVACWLAARIGSKGLAGIFTFSVVWTLVEYTRGHMFTGFPWNLAGYSFAFSDASLQLASVIGAYGLTWWAVWLGTIPAALKDYGQQTTYAVILSFALFMVAIGWGQWRLTVGSYGSDSMVSGVWLRLVQANIAQPHKWDPKLQMQGLQEHVRLTQQPGLDHVTHVIWPETAVPYMVKDHTPLVTLLGSAVPPKTLLITGALREEGEGENWQIWNSLVAISHGGAIAGSYDKSKLVPFGEFVPLRWMLPASWLTPVGAKDFSYGPGPETLVWPGLPRLSPLICYEAIFPELAVNRADRPQMLLNVTNDAWFGFSSGPHQHFHMARTRAVEQGLPLVRVANTGITAVTDAYGRVLARMGLGEKGILDVGLPQALQATPYAQYWDGFLFFLVFANAVLIIMRRRALIN